MKRKFQLILVVAFLAVLMASPQNLWSSSDIPTIGVQSDFVPSVGESW